MRISVRDLHDKICHLRKFDDNDDQLKTRIETLLKNLRNSVMGNLPSIEAATEDQLFDQSIVQAEGKPVMDLADRPHIDKAQLTIAHLQACVENAKDGIVVIDRQILQNYKDQRMSIIPSAGSLSTIEKRIANFVNESLGQQSPSTPQPKAHL